jgi:hypothetical protein
MVPSTPTIVAFVQSAYKLTKQGQEVFTGLDVMKYALENNLWSTKQQSDKQLMTTWAFYLKKLKELGLKEHGSISHNGTRLMSIEEILELDNDEE